ncbi:serine hydrolase domain-containing protein [Caballeronia sp. GaOx3]|uniref:serine hydrolase domain-containing protein n=1 Tax=Caballeronia sp. GaOx3 TaxID=2921740 RepID=UPI0028AD5D6B|nr:serine hydrolase domain-containing protein [Caballeronia sp. GaOx3]
MTRLNSTEIESLGRCVEPVSASRRYFLGLAGAGVVANLLPGCGGGHDSNSQPYAQTVAMGQQIIPPLIASGASTTISIAMLKGNNVFWQQAFGLSSVPNQVSATTQTRFNIGSVSKLFAALSAVILQDRGLVSLDMPLVRYLPTFTMLSREYTQITIRQLLSHSAGLPGTNSPDLFSFAPVSGYAAATQALMAYTHLAHLPGEFAVYCNDGFTMIEPLVSAMTGQTFTDFVEANILSPLQMTNSGYLTSVPTTGSFAYPYINGTQHQEFVNAYGAGGMSTTPSDMMNLAKMLLGGGVFQGKRIVSASGIEQMAPDQTKGYVINPSPKWRWGLAWDSVVQPGLAAAGILGWEKEGGTAYFSSEFFVVPQAQLALLVTGTMPTPSGFDARKVAETLIFSALKEEGTISALPPTVGGTVPPVSSGGVIGDAVGIYGNANAPLQVVAGSDGSLEINQWNASTPTWTPVNTYQYRSDGWWWSNNDNANSYRFTTVSGTDASGSAFSYRYLMKRVSPGAGYAFVTLPWAQQMAPLAPLDAAWQQRLGTQWTMTNDAPSDVTYVIDKNPPVILSSLAELPGYVLFGNASLGYQLSIPLSDDRGGMSMKIPVNFGRDLDEMRFSPATNSTTLKVSSGVYVKV